MPLAKAFAWIRKKLSSGSVWQQIRDLPKRNAIWAPATILVMVWCRIKKKGYAGIARQQSREMTELNTAWAGVTQAAKASCRIMKKLSFGV